jgi:proline dehydrogenase
MATGMQKEWQRGMAALARSPRTKAFMQSRAAAFLVRKFVAGDSPAAGAEYAARLLKDKGQRASLYSLGAAADTAELVREHVGKTLEAVAALQAAGLDVHVSVEPTQLGQHQSLTLLRENAQLIAMAVQAGAARPKKGSDPAAQAGAPAGAGVHCLMLHVEDHESTDATIALHDALRALRLPVGLTLQANLRRTAADLQRQIDAGSKVRLVKGGYAEDEEIAFQGDAEVKHGFRELIYRMFSPDARARGFYPVVATHDTTLHDLAIGLARKHEWPLGHYEFELLLGVRPRVAESLVRRGERVRIYLPHGRDWWPYVVRRVGENPAKLGLLRHVLFD